jgi:hypothetical protein
LDGVQLNEDAPLILRPQQWVEDILLLAQREEIIEQGLGVKFVDHDKVLEMDQFISDILESREQIDLTVILYPLPKKGDRIEMVVDMRSDGGHDKHCIGRRGRQLTQGMQGVVTGVLDMFGDRRFLIQFDDRRADRDEDWIKHKNYIGNVKICYRSRAMHHRLGVILPLPTVEHH